MEQCGVEVRRKGCSESMWTEKQNRQASVLLNLRCPQNRVTHLEGVSKSIQCVEPYGQCHSQSTKQRTGGAALWIRKLLLQYRWIISSLTGPSWDFSHIFREMKNRAECVFGQIWYQYHFREIISPYMPLRSCSLCLAHGDRICF